MPVPSSLSDTATFHVAPCSGMPADDVENLSVHAWTTCTAGAWMKTVLFTLWYDGDVTKQLLWTLNQDGTVFDSGSLAISSAGGVFGGAQVEPGGYYLTVTDAADASPLYNILVIVGQCGDPPPDPVDPTDPADPADPVDPTDPTDPTDPVDPVEPVDPTVPVEPSELVDLSGQPNGTETSDTAGPAWTGTLPATR